jgi:electron transport complex protein RnfB
MAKDIYQKLARHLDNLPGGFPATQNGIELRILRRLFSPEEAEIMGNACGKPIETCLVFGAAADYYVRNGIGREIDKQEALDILKMADEAGLVLQPSNAQKIVNICCCCGCCCQVLKSIKRYPRPATLVSTPFVASLDTYTCKGCGKCVERCQMEALRLEDEKAVLDVDRCIGCGLCVSTCPTGSLTLVRKPDVEQKEVPRNMTEAFLNLARERGKLGTLSLTTMRFKSKLDRRLATR